VHSRAVAGPRQRPDADRDRIESMPKARRGARSRRSGRIVAVKSETAVLKADSEELTKAVRRATEVFGDEAAAFRWLGTPVAALDYAPPISCLGTHRGAMRVNDLLTQIEHGVW
jgi:putative toxin-antitoxin system antitoxin component (TIGR02293 family)